MEEHDLKPVTAETLEGLLLLVNSEMLEAFALGQDYVGLMLLALSLVLVLALTLPLSLVSFATLHHIHPPPSPPSHSVHPPRVAAGAG